MTDREKVVLRYFDGCRWPARQVKIVAELNVLPIAEVLKILKKYGRVPVGVTPQNYKRILKGPVVKPIDKNLEHFLTYGHTSANLLQQEIKIPRRITLELRENAWRKEDGDE